MVNVYNNDRITFLSYSDSHHLISGSMSVIIAPQEVLNNKEQRDMLI